MGNEWVELGMVNNEEINASGHLEGDYIPNENIRFMESGVIFNKSNIINEIEKKENITEYTDITKKFDSFQLDIKSGSIKREEIIGIIGTNSSGSFFFTSAQWFL